MHKPKISWGTIIAGAAIATGAVLFAPSMFPAIGTAIVEGAKSIGSWIVETFTGSAPVAGNMLDTLTNAFSSTTARQVAGAALMGGGATYLLSGKSEDVALPKEPSQPSESFAMKEDMRKMQALMAVRMQAAGAPVGQPGMGRA